MTKEAQTKVSVASEAENDDYLIASVIKYLQQHLCSTIAVSEIHCDQAGSSLSRNTKPVEISPSVFPHYAAFSRSL